MCCVEIFNRKIKNENVSAYSIAIFNLYSLRSKYLHLIHNHNGPIETNTKNKVIQATAQLSTM